MVVDFSNLMLYAGREPTEVGLIEKFVLVDGAGCANPTLVMFLMSKNLVNCDRVH